MSEILPLDLSKEETAFLDSVGAGLLPKDRVIRAILRAGGTLDIDLERVEDEESLKERIKSAIIQG